MAIRAKLTVKGFEAYLDQIARAGRDIGAITDEALEAGGKVLLEGMQRRVPKDTRNLEEHLAVDGPQHDGNFHYIEVGLPKRTDSETARYGTAQEYGTANMPAQPYIRPTLDQDIGKARRVMREIFKARGAL